MRDPSASRVPLAESRIAPESLRPVKQALAECPLEGAIVLGSGLGALCEAWTPFARFAADEIPGYPRPAVAGHSGAVELVRFGARALIVLSGRVHFYEGHDRAAVTFGPRLVAALGARWLLLTNASGSFDPRITPSTALVIDDHLRTFLGSRARGRPPARLSCGSPYHPGRTDALFRVLAEEGLRVARGVLYGALGPNYETAAEVEMIRRMGAHAGCMSTVVEAEEAARLGLEVTAVSLVTNYGTGLAGRALGHDEVMTSGAQFGPPLARGLERLVRMWMSAE